MHELPTSSAPEPGRDPGVWSSTSGTGRNSTYWTPVERGPSATLRGLFERHSPVAILIMALAVLLLAYNLDVFDITRLFTIPGITGLGGYVVLWGLVVYQHRSRNEGYIKPSVPGLLLIAILLLSVLWSDVPDYTAVRLRTYGPALATAWMTAAGLRSDEFRIVMRWLARVTLGTVTLIIAVYPWARATDDADMAGWHGQYSKNGLGLVLAFVMALLLAFEVGLTRIIEIAVLLVLSAGNGSRTSQATMLLMAIIVVGSRWLHGAQGWHDQRNRVIMMAWTLTGVGVVAFFLRDALLASVGKDPTLTQRTAIWHAVIPQIEKAPWLGHGAFAFLEADSKSPSQQAVASYFHLFVPPHSHNGALDLMGQLGIVGLAAYLAALVASIRLMRRVRDPQIQRFCILIVGFILLSGLVEPTYLGGWLIVMAFLDGQVRRIAAHELTPPRFAALRFAGTQSENAEIPTAGKGSGNLVQIL